MKMAVFLVTILGAIFAISDVPTPSVRKLTQTEVGFLRINTNWSKEDKQRIIYTIDTLYRQEGIAARYVRLVNTHKDSEWFKTVKPQLDQAILDGQWDVAHKLMFDMEN